MEAVSGFEKWGLIRFCREKPKKCKKTLPRPSIYSPSHLQLVFRNPSRRSAYSITGAARHETIYCLVWAFSHVSAKILADFSNLLKIKLMEA